MYALPETNPGCAICVNAFWLSVMVISLLQELSAAMPDTRHAIVIILVKCDIFIYFIIVLVLFLLSSRSR